MLRIKRPGTYELAKQLAEITGESLTEAVTKALEERLALLEEPVQAENDREVAGFTKPARRSDSISEDRSRP